MLLGRTSIKKQKRCASSLSPPQENVVKLLCQFVREEKQSTKNPEVNVTYLIFKCPNQHCRNKDNEIKFKKGHGYTNAFNHLKTCLYYGNAEELMFLYESNLVRKQSCVSTFLIHILSVSEEEQCLYDCIQLCIDENLPPSIIKQQSFRKFKRGAKIYFN